MEKTHNGRGFEEITREAQEKLDQAGIFFNQQANQLRQGMVHQLRDAAANIRKQTADKPLDEEQRVQVDTVLTRLDEMSTYLEGHTVEEIEKEATEVVRRHVWRNLIIAFVIGVFVGLFLARRD